MSAMSFAMRGRTRNLQRLLSPALTAGGALNVTASSTRLACASAPADIVANFSTTLASQSESSSHSFPSTDRVIERRLTDSVHRRRSQANSNDSSHVRIPDSREHEPPFSKVGPEQAPIMKALIGNMKALDYKGAIAVLNTLPENPGLEWQPVYRFVLSICVKAFAYDAASDVWNKMPSRDIFSYNSMLHLLGRYQRFDEMADLMKEMESASIEKSGHTHGTLVNAYANAHQWEKALSYLDTMKTLPELANQDLSIPNFFGMIGCARAGEREKTRALLNEITKTSPPTNNHYNLLLMACQQDGPAALDIFEEMKSLGMTPTIRDWSVLISCHRSDWDKQVALYEEMKPLHSKELEEIWAQLLYSATFTENRAACVWIFKEMEKCGVSPRDARQDARPILRRRVALAFKLLSRKHQESPVRDAAPVFDAAPSQSSPLPSGWGSAVDPGSGMEYYWREDNPAGTTTWTRPTH